MSGDVKAQAAEVRLSELMEDVAASFDLNRRPGQQVLARHAAKAGLLADGRQWEPLKGLIVCATHNNGHPEYPYPHLPFANGECVDPRAVAVAVETEDGLTIGEAQELIDRG